MDQTQYDALLNDADTRLDRLRALYDQFFQGLERLEPTQLRKDFERVMGILRKEQPNNTMLRFRFQQLVQRYVTLETHWRKVLRQIEEGTYRRDVLRARRRRQGRHADAATAPQVHEIDMTLDADDDFDDVLGNDVERSGSMLREPVDALPPPSPSSPPPAPRAISPFAVPSLRPSQPPPGMPEVTLAQARTRSSQRPVASKSFRPPKPDVIPKAPRFPAGISETRPVANPTSTAANTNAASYSSDQMRRLYERYVDARKGNNERVDNVKLESLQKTVEAMLPKLREKHGGKQIDFDVVVRDGKVALKPITK